MAGKENSFEIASQNFDRALQVIKDSRVDGISDIAKRTIAKIRTGEIRLAAASSDAGKSTVTRFDLEEITPGFPPEYAPAIFLDPDKMLSGRDEFVQADLVRTIAIADQYPSGFQRRYNEVYGDALETQASWLNARPETSSTTVDLDPRLTTRRQMTLLELLGEDRYYLDVGFNDWQKAINEYTSPLTSSMDTPGLFISIREALVPKQFHIIQKQVDDEFLKFSTDERALIAARLLLGSVAHRQESRRRASEN